MKLQLHGLLALTSFMALVTAAPRMEIVIKETTTSQVNHQGSKESCTTPNKPIIISLDDDDHPPVCGKEGDDCGFFTGAGCCYDFVCSQTDLGECRKSI